MTTALQAAIARGAEEMEKRRFVLLRQLSELRGEVEALGHLRPRGMKGSYTEIIALIDRRMEELDRVGCESSDDIDEGLKA